MEDKHSWHLSRSLSVGHLVSTIVIILGGYSFVSDLEKQILENQLSQRNLAERMNRTETRHSEQFGEIKDMLKDMAVKIDALNRG
tara:strand:+ start:853 stop:1107 length:255 start_codon:yes stop_codon:yes gene_type:complete